jgi:diguanylate cyclase (GGDEF)-like protein/PAS domain S-box-containing protein
MTENREGRGDKTASAGSGTPPRASRAAMSEGTRPTALIEAVGVAVLVCDPRRVILDMNRLACDLLGVGRDDAVGHPVGVLFASVPGRAGSVVTESGAALRLAPLAARVFSGERVDGEVVGLVAPSGGGRQWLRISAEPLRSPDGELEAIVATLVDITRLKAAGDALDQAVSELNDLVETLPDTYVYVDGADVVLQVTGKRPPGPGVAGVLTGRGVGEPVWKSLSEDAAGKIRKAAALARATNKPVIAEIATVSPTAIRYDEVRHIPRESGNLLLAIRDITESRRAAEALRQSEEKYRTLYLRTPVMLHSIDAEGRLLSVSDRWLQRLGYTSDEVLGRPSIEFLTEESRRFAREEVLPAFFATGSCEDVPYQMVASDGSVVDVLLSATSERDAGGSVVRSLAVLVDITEQRRADRQLAERDRTMRTLLGNVPGMAYRCANDADWTMLVLNDGCEDITGYDPDELMGDAAVTYAGLIDPRDRQSVWTDIQAALARREPWTITYRITARDASMKWVWERGVGVLDDAGELQYLEGFISDISELHDAEVALREREQMLSGLVGSLPGAAYRSDLYEPWRTSFLSEGFRALLGHDPEVFTSGTRTWAEIVHPDDLERIVRELHRDLDAGKADTESEYRILTASGAARWVLDRAVFVSDDEGRPHEMIGLLIDVTSLHEALAAQAESERRLRTTIGNIPGMVYRSQAEAPWSDELIAGGDVSVTGYSPEELTHPGFRWVDIMHADDVHRLTEATRTAEQTGRGSAEYRIRTKDGAERWLLDRFTLLRDDEGEPKAQEGILVDVSEQHLVQDALSASQRELELHARIATIFLTAAPDEMFTAALAVVREALGARWGFFGYLDAEGALVAPSLDAEVWDACRVGAKRLRFPADTWSDNTWARAIRSGRTQVLSGEGVVPKGHLPVSRAVATPIVYGGQTIGVFIVAERETDFGDEDVRLLEGIAASTAPVLFEWRERHQEESARREAELALRASEQKYRSLYEGSPMGVFLYDGDLVFLDCNHAFEELAGGSGELFAALSLPEVVNDPLVLSALESALLGEEGVFEGPYTTTTTGRELWITLKTAPRYDAGGGVIGGTGVVVDRTEQKRTEEQVQHLLLHDPLTGLANRALLEDRTAQALKHAGRKRLAFSVAAFRVDRFDTVGSSLGHGDTDRFLEELGRRLQRAGRAEDTLAYLGGGTIAALLPGAAGPTEATAAVGKILATVGEPLRVGTRELFLTLSLGVAIYPSDGVTAAELLSNADAAMRRASDEGGDRWQFFHSSMNAERADRLELDAELHRALESEQFFLEYQPMVATATEEIVAVEALVRWRHPKRGVVPPLEFIPAAEDSGIMIPIGAWVLAEACRQGRAWQRELGRPLRMGVNISARQLHDETLVDTVRRTLRATGFDPRALELEITETAAMRDARHTAQILGALRTMGVRVALDDFGTGYSSLSHLVRLPISTVKIDRSFVRDLLTVPEHAAVAASVIALGHRLGLTVVAEGVETIGERGALREEGADAIQGFLYSRPVDAETCWKLLAAGQIRR